MSEDLIETLLDIEPGTPLASLRAERSDIRKNAQGAYRELVLPSDPGGVTLLQRAALAERVARQDNDPALADHFRSLLPPDHDHAAESPVGAPGRLPLLMAYTDKVATHPKQVDQAAIDELTAAGFSPQDIVAVTQLTAFVPYQVRLLSGLRAMQGKAAIDAPEPVAADVRFTQAEVGWTPRIPPVDADTATPAQLAALDACPPAVRRSTYFLTLAQDPASLGERGALFNSVMYAPRGLPRAEREIATAIVSMVNGCVYCCSVHARRYSELTQDTTVMQTLFEQGFGASLPPRLRAIVDAAAKLTATPESFGAADLVPLRAAGLAELELLDLIHAIAMFANANRLMMALGESIPPAA